MIDISKKILAGFRQAWRVFGEWFDLIDNYIVLSQRKKTWILTPIDQKRRPLKMIGLAILQGDVK